MPVLPALVAALALVAAASVIGFVLRSRSGRVRHGSGDTVRAADVAAGAPFGDRATLVQFSTEFCSRCPQTRTLLSEVAASRHGVVHLDVDLTHRPDLARRFSVLQTPTTLVLDGNGAVRARIGGAPRRTELVHELDTVLRSTT